MQIDETYTDIHRDDIDRAVVKLVRPDGATVQLWAGKGYPHLEIFTGDTLAPGRRRRGLGVEPMTGPPNALASGEDLLTWQPQQTVDFRWGVASI
jgi:aldose 1-epimerase